QAPATARAVRGGNPLADLSLPRGKQYWKETSEGIFYTPTTGIWQTVWLEPLPARHVESLRLRPDLTGGALDFEVGGEGPIELTASLAGSVVGRWSGSAGSGRVGLGEGQGWSPEWPRRCELGVGRRSRGVAA